MTSPSAIQRNWRADAVIVPIRVSATIPIGNCATVTSTAPTTAVSCSSDLTIDCLSGCGTLNAARVSESATAIPTWNVSGIATQPTLTTLSWNASGYGYCWEVFSSRIAIVIDWVIDWISSFVGPIEVCSCC